MKKKKKKNLRTTILGRNLAENLEVHANRSVLNILPLSPGFRNFDCSRHSRGLIHKRTHERERERHTRSQPTPAFRLSSSSSTSPSSSFTALHPSPDSQPPSFRWFFRQVRAFYVQGSSWAIGGAGGRKGAERNVQEESFQIPRHLNIRTNSTPSPPRSSRPLELASVDQRTDTNRGCIQRALSLSLSLGRPSSFHLVSSSVDVHTASVTLPQLSLCPFVSRSIYRTTPVLLPLFLSLSLGCTGRGVRYWRTRGKPLS